MDWIEFAKQKPKERGAYLVWHPDCTSMGVALVGHYAILRWTGRKFISSFPVTHWTKLTKPKP